jgi:hypothetical protein
MRKVLTAAAVVLLLGAAGVIGILRLTADDGPPAPPPGVQGDGAEAAAGAQPGAEAGRFDPFASGGLQPAPSEPPQPERFAAGSAPDLAASGTRLPPVPPKEPWVTVPLRPRDLRTLWIEISTLRPELPSCWADEPRAALSPSGGGNKGLSPGGAPSALILEIENAGGTLRVLEIAVDTLGDDRRTTVECGRQQLKGLSFKLPGSLEGSPIARPGTRARMRFVLQ